MNTAATTTNDTFDIAYTFGRPVDSYVSTHDHARLLILRGRLQDRIEPFDLDGTLELSSEYMCPSCANPNLTCYHEQSES